ncbi:MAG: ABC transporter substrate-binding protein [Candidatus Rehaiarchaeum fermentans]|nr:ABC transporter substrate-binding protein [Candidatus Rehaiarchaeum fermentans]
MNENKTEGNPSNFSLQNTDYISPLPPLPSPAPTPVPPPPSQPSQPSSNLPPPNQPKLNYRSLIYIIVGIVVVLAIVVIYIKLVKSPFNNIVASPSVLSTYVGYNIQMSLNNLQKGDYVIIEFAGKNYTYIANSSQVSYPLNSTLPGEFIALAYVFSNKNLIYKSKPFIITIYPKISPTQPYIQPIIYFSSTKNPYAPFFLSNSSVDFFLGYLEKSSSSLNITKYILSISNSHNFTIKVNSSTQGPLNNSLSLRLNPGNYLIKLEIEAINSSNSSQVYNFSTYQNIIISNSIPLINYYAPSNSHTIVVAENVPGGPYSFDPQIDYENIGGEVISNIFATLLFYNGSSTNSFIPYVAAYVPTVGHGINSNYTVYNFTIRPGLKFSNGDPLNAYAVWYTFIRALLFNGGVPTTPDWIIAQYLIPNFSGSVPIVNQTNITLAKQAFSEIMHAVTYNNVTNTVTFHLAKPTPPLLFFQAVADPLGGGIVDPLQLKKIGQAINFTPAGFARYENYANEGNYSQTMQYDPVSSGPYMIATYIPGQSVTLVPNPYFKGIPGIPKPNDSVVIYWVKDPQTAYYLFSSKDADIVSYLPTQYFVQIKNLEEQGLAHVYEFPTLSIIFFGFNINVNTSLMKSVFGNNYNLPSDYFANPYIRKAFSFAFNESEYLNQIVGNQKYGFDFGDNYTNAIAYGLPYYTPPNKLSNWSKFNLTYAKELLIQSGYYNLSVNIPVVVPSGDTQDYEAVVMWGKALNSIDPNIVLSPVYLPFSQIIGYLVPGEDPIPIVGGIGWAPDYPYPADYVNNIYLPTGAYAGGLGWQLNYLNSTYPQEAIAYEHLINTIKSADNATNSSVAAKLYEEVSQQAINLYMYVYTIQQNQFWITDPYIYPYENKITYEENPMFGGSGEGLYFWWNKA